MNKYLKLYKRCLSVARNKHEKEVITEAFSMSLNCKKCSYGDRLSSDEDPCENYCKEALLQMANETLEYNKPLSLFWLFKKLKRTKKL